MPALIADLVAVPELELRVIGGVVPDEVVVSWAHSSDLVDPTPFIGAGQMLLTTGTQFPDGQQDAFYDAYVGRLVGAGVVALGFGTEVSRSGAPRELRESADRQGLLLVEVPYRVPFIAVARWIADVSAAEERARAEWGLRTQRAVSLAALGAGGIEAAIDRCARALEGRLVLFGPGLDVVHSSHRYRAVESVESAAREILASGRRGRRELDAAPRGWGVLETLGPERALLGCLLVERRDPLDRFELSVTVTLLSLIEVHLAERAAVRRTFRILMDEMLGLLLEGDEERARAILHPLGVDVPRGRFVVIAVEDRAGADVAGLFERASTAATAGVFVARLDRATYLLAGEEAADRVLELLRRDRVRAGMTRAADWSRLRSDLAEADHALRVGLGGEVTVFENIDPHRMLGLASEELAGIARARLAVLGGGAEGNDLLDQAVVWLGEQGQWQPAAERLGIHRHVLRRRMADLGRELGLDLDEFSARVELWLLLTASGRA